MRARYALIAILIAFCLPSLLPGAGKADWQFLEDGDRLRIRIFNRRGELEYDLREVVREGELILPLLGPIPVRRLGLGRFRERVRSELARSYMRDPYVHVHMERSAQVLMKGPFLPRMIEVEQGASLFQALSHLHWNGSCRTVRLHRGRFTQDFAMDGLLKGYRDRGLLVGMRDGDILELLP